MLDEQIIELFFERSKQAISELDNKYGKIIYTNENDALIRFSYTYGYS